MLFRSAACRHPVLTGIGHERDVSVADEVAHEAHKTPTAAAVAVVERVRAWVRRTEDAWDGVAARAVALLDARARHLALVEQAIARRPREVVRLETARLDAHADRLRLLDPVFTMARGWSITRTTDGRTVRSAADLQPGDHIITTFATGTATRDRKSTRLNSSHVSESRMPSSA